MIYLTVIGYTPGGSSTVHIYRQYIERHNRIKQYVEQHISKQYIKQHNSKA
jgi:hypothetical protein